MRISVYADPDIGSFDWDLPQPVANAISKLPEQEQMDMRRRLSEEVALQLSLLARAALMGPESAKAFHFIHTTTIATTDVLLQMLKP